MPADALYMVLCVLAVFGFFMALLVFTDVSESRRLNSVAVRSGGKRVAADDLHRRT